MSNMWGRSGAPMIQPTKDELRYWLQEAREEADTERGRRVQAEHELKIAKRKLGRLVIEGKIVIPAEQLGEIVLRMADVDENEIDERERKLLTQG